MNLDYSRFNRIVDSDDEEEPRRRPIPSSSAARAVPDNLPGPEDENFPQELRDAFNMMRYSKITGDEGARQKATELAMKAVQDGGPEVRARFEEAAKTMMERA